MDGTTQVIRTYTRAERLTDAAVHVTGVLTALLAVPVLVTLAFTWLDDRRLVLAAAIYGATLLVMLSCSALYHMTPWETWKDRLRRLDQSAIYLKIAGAYTPFAVMTGPPAMPFLAGLWAAAVAGVSLKMIVARQLFGLTVAFYLAMGWAALVAGGPILDRMSTEGYRLVVSAGLLYTIGVVFLIWDQLPFHTAIWHVFVLTASLALYAAVLVELAGLRIA